MDLLLEVLKGYKFRVEKMAYYYLVFPRWIELILK
jgi:hypothetical protein